MPILGSLKDSHEEARGSEIQMGWTKIVSADDRIHFTTTHYSSWGLGHLDILFKYIIGPIMLSSCPEDDLSR